MKDLLGDLLRESGPIYGVLCRDATLTDLELIRLAGYQIVWFDLEHGPASLADVLAHIRTAEHLGLVSLVRIPELTRAFVQPLLDQGVRVIVVPDVRTATEARELVRIARFPPLGQRGGASATAWNGYARGDEVPGLLRAADETVHLMAQIESDEGYEALDEILAVPGIDMITVGPLDWRLRAGPDADIPAKVEQVIARATRAGKTAALLVSGPDEAARYIPSGLRIVFVGSDIGLKQRVLRETLERFRGGARA